jgi:hypothetical protein
MSAFVKIPNLPLKPIKTVLISAEAPKSAFIRLQNLDVEPIAVPPCENLARPVCTHPDMQFHHLGGHKMVYYPNKDLSACRRLSELGFILKKCDKELNSVYPNDIALNAARVGQSLLCHPDYTDQTILKYCTNNQIHIRPVRQGYAKCSTCVVDNNSIVTADRNIARCAKQFGIDVLLIQPGFINLPGYETGFFGGCCGKLSANKLFVCGDLTLHPDYIRIYAFLQERDIALEMLRGEPLTDIGSVLPISEKA